jgi:hypothetical protein
MELDGSFRLRELATALSSQPMLRLLISAVLGSTTVGGIRL